jgi:hypothetical protein
VSWGQKWFTKSAINVSIEPDLHNYMSDKDNPIYLVTSFSDTTAVYIPRGDDSSTTRGNLVLISKEIIYAIDLQS